MVQKISCSLPISRFPHIPLAVHLQSPVMSKLLRFALLLLAFSPLYAQTAPYDLIIRNGHIIDGTGSPWYSGDIGIRNGRIAAIGFFGAAQAKRTIDGAG